MSPLDYLLLGVVLGVLLVLRRPMTTIIAPPPTDFDRTSGIGCLMPIVLAGMLLVALALVGGM